MTTISSTTATVQDIPARSGSGRLRSSALKRWWQAYIAWRAEQAAIATLSGLSDRELKDFGLTRSGIAGAVREAMRDTRSVRH
jgi:uncharacterized protein YjiS (DUF1127 family)